MYRLFAQEIPLLGIYTEDVIKSVHNKDAYQNIVYSREMLKVQGGW